MSTSFWSTLWSQNFISPIYLTKTEQLLESRRHYHKPLLIITIALAQAIVEALLRNYPNEVNENVQYGHRSLHLTIWSISNSNQVWWVIIYIYIYGGIINGKNSDKNNIFSASKCVGGHWKLGLVESFDACNIYKTRNTHKT